MVLSSFTSEISHGSHCSGTSFERMSSSMLVPGVLDNSPIFHLMQFISSVGLIHSSCRLLFSFSIHLKYDEDVVPLEKSSSQAEENRDKPSLPSLWFEPVSTISFRMFDRVKSLYYYSGTSTPTSIPLGKCTSFPAATDNHQVKQLRRMTFQLFRLLSSGKLHLFTWWRLIQIFPEWGKMKSNQIKFTDIHWRYKICQKKPKILFVKIKLNNSWGSEIKEFSHQADKMNFDELTCRIFPQNDY